MAFVVAVVAFGGFGGLLARAAEPRGPVIELTIIHALQSDGGAAIDPRLRDLPQLTRDQPFVRYNVYKLLEPKAASARARASPRRVTLPNGRALQVTLVDEPRTPSGVTTSRAEIGEPGKKAFLKLLEVTASGNEPFFVGGQSFQGGTLFLELRRP